MGRAFVGSDFCRDIIAMVAIPRAMVRVDICLYRVNRLVGCCRECTYGCYVGGLSYLFVHGHVFMVEKLQCEGCKINFIKLLCFFLCFFFIGLGFDDLFAVVIATVQTNLVWLLYSMAMRALVMSVRVGHKVVRTACALACF